MSDETDAPLGGAEGATAPEVVENTPEATAGQPEVGADDPTLADDAGAEPKPKQVPWFQKRIDEVTAKKYEAEREAAYWRGIAEGQSPRQQQAPAQEGPPREDQFESYEDFETARIEYAVEQRLKVKEAQQQRQSVVQSYEQRVASFAASKPDYVSVVNNPSLRITDVMADVIRESEVGPQVAYHLGTNPEEAARIAGLSQHRQAVELGKLEVKLTSAPAQTPRTPPPPPPQTVSGISAGLNKAPEEMSMAEFIKWREAGGGGA